MTNQEALEQFTVKWDGSFDGAWWREYSDAPPPLVPQSMTARVRDYMETHTEWMTARQVRMAIEASYDDTDNCLCRLTKQGQVERVKNAAGRWEYRWKLEARDPLERRSWQARRAELARHPQKRTVRSASEYAAMRARLERAS